MGSTLHVARDGRWWPLAVSAFRGELFQRHDAPQALHGGGERMDLRPWNGERATISSRSTT